LRQTIHRLAPARGFTLLEVLVATALLFVAIAALAGLSIMATRANAAARTTTFTSLLAAQKMEELLAGNGADLSPSPADALTRNAPGYCDFLDAAGRSLGGGSSPPAQSAFVRRWSLEPLPSSPVHALALQVLVIRVGSNQADTGRAGPDEAAFVSVRTRGQP
jgi:Tfp pilus assembly protein PilV